MTEGIFSRSELLLGEQSSAILKEKKVAVIGLGGVGSYVAECLARSAIGHFLLVDNDTVNLTNLNRQIVALHSTLGKLKTEVMKNRILDINPNADVKVLNSFILPENILELKLEEYDYVVDAVDTVSAKISLSKFCFENNIGIISAMGTGNKLSPLNFEITDITKTKTCPLAKVIRRELKKLNITSLNVCYSKEEVKKRQGEINEDGARQRPTTASLPYVPSVCGLYIGYFVVKQLLGDNYPTLKH